MLISLINHIIKIRKKETATNKGKGKNNSLVLPSLFVLLFLLGLEGGGGTSGAQGWVPGRSAMQTIEFHFLSAPELRQDV